jgi:hypothetical protein
MAGTSTQNENAETHTAVIVAADATPNPPQVHSALRGDRQQPLEQHARELEQQLGLVGTKGSTWARSP